MDVDPNQGPGDSSLVERLNLFALVTYVPDPLGRFLDELRRELVPHDNPRAHVSVLPPRPLSVDWSVASRQVRARTDLATPFDIELGEIRVFPVTDVIYLELASGAAELRRLHSAMCQGALAFHEPFAYHPHLTLAQEIANPEVEAMRATAIGRWQQYSGPRQFRVERVVLVQNTLDHCWIDLADYALGAVAVR